MKKHTIAALLFFGATLLPAMAQDGKTQLTVLTPMKSIVGTPKPPIWPNLDKTPQKHPKLFVPKGTTNLAAKKTVTSSDKIPIVGELTYITDGEKLADEGYEVEFAPGPQWVQIDLEKVGEIYAIAVWHFHRQERAYKAVVVQISNDPTFKSGVTTVFNADFQNLHKLGAGSDKTYVETFLGKVIPVNAVKGRYVRLYSAGNTSDQGNHYVEVEVYGI
ncbi:MAG: discoidin domain-containing protein [Puniceicoccales bacterium]|jgi:hypothetical protein|nr:discoidin domain-containing protein [Puniceicoccales bacterium]